MSTVTLSAELSAWRKSERARLLRERDALTQETLAERRARMDMHIERTFPDLVHGLIAFCWPYRNEYDVRHLAAALRRRGAKTAMPVVVAPKTPLIFREWHPGVGLAEGPLGIPYPVGSPEVVPDHVLLPMVGWDGDGYRLGYGGAFFDRTLASLEKRPRVIGLAYEQAYLKTIQPQPHDIPVDFVVTERGVYRREPKGLRFLDNPEGFSSPPCYAGEIGPGYFGEDSKT
ncbi:MAG TPA: 5-formyltetrahydrofolate cyclo-ligase [Burkholderiales bacterium]|nr:5-formyltetrahydrofolate cyclo-ligase [Burkholderiales bacterium]